MKKFISSLIVILLFSINGNAQKEADTSTKNVFKEAELITKINGEETKYTFKSQAEFEEGSDKIIAQLISENSNNKLADACSITITMTVTVTVEGNLGVAGGSVSVTVTGTITATCDAAVQAGKDLRKNLIAMAQG